MTTDISPFLTLLILFLIPLSIGDPEPEPDFPADDASKWPKNVRVAVLSINEDNYKITERDVHHRYADSPPISSVVPMSSLAEFLTNNVKGSIQKLEYTSMQTENGTYLGSEQWFYDFLSAVPRKRFVRMDELSLNGAFTQLDAIGVREIFNKLFNRVTEIKLTDFHLPVGNLSAKGFLALRVVREARHLTLRGDEQENVNFTIDSTTIVRWAKTVTPRDKMAAKKGEVEVKQLELIDEYLKDGIGKLLRVANEDFRAAKKKSTYKITVHCHETEGLVPKEAQEFGFEFNSLGEELAVETFDHGHNPAFQIQRTDALGEGGDDIVHDEL